MKHSGFQHAEPAQIIFYAGSVGKTFYVIAEGNVGIYIEGKISKDKLTGAEKSYLGLDSSDEEIEKDNEFEGASHLSDQIQAVFRPSVKYVEEENTVYFMHKINSLHAGQSFGELALLDDKNTRRTASVIAETTCNFLVLDKNNYRNILGFFENREVNKMIDFLCGTHLFHGWERRTLKTIKFHFEKKTYKRGHVLFSEGDDPFKVYVVKKGKLKLQRAVSLLDFLPPRVSGEKSELMSFAKKIMVKFILLGKHEIVGDEDVVLSKKRSYTCVCEENVELLEIEGKQFMRRVLFDESHRDTASELIKNKTKRWQEYFEKAVEAYKKNMSRMIPSQVIYKIIFQKSKGDFSQLSFSESNLNPSKKGQRDAVPVKSKSRVYWTKRRDGEPVEHSQPTRSKMMGYSFNGTLNDSGIQSLAQKNGKMSELTKSKSQSKFQLHSKTINFETQASRDVDSSLETWNTQVKKGLIKASESTNNLLRENSGKNTLLVQNKTECFSQVDQDERERKSPLRILQESRNAKEFVRVIDLKLKRIETECQEQEKELECSTSKSYDFKINEKKLNVKMFEESLRKMKALKSSRKEEDQKESQKVSSIESKEEKSSALSAKKEKERNIVTPTTGIQPEISEVLSPNIIVTEIASKDGKEKRYEGIHRHSTSLKARLIMRKSKLGLLVQGSKCNYESFSSENCNSFSTFPNNGNIPTSSTQRVLSEEGFKCSGATSEQKMEDLPVSAAEIEELRKTHRILGVTRRMESYKEPKEIRRIKTEVELKGKGQGEVEKKEIESFNKKTENESRTSRRKPDKTQEEIGFGCSFKNLRFGKKQWKPKIAGSPSLNFRLVNVDEGVIVAKNF